uniref:protein-serine/threonine phosphatase n=1 Tax=Leersia perrieri TaxID=77586 RepID=A0A0D9WKI5_9ORYZ
MSTHPTRHLTDSWAPFLLLLYPPSSAPHATPDPIPKSLLLSASSPLSGRRRHRRAIVVVVGGGGEARQGELARSTDRIELAPSPTACSPSPPRLHSTPPPPPCRSPPPSLTSPPPPLPMEDVAVPAAPTLSSHAAAGLTLFAAAAVAEAMEEALGAALPPPVTAVPGDEDNACGSPCSVTSDCSSVASADFEGFAELGPALVAGSDDLTAAVVVAEAADPPRAVGATARSVFAMDCVPLWGLESICGRRQEMEDDYVIVPRFFNLPLWMVAGDAAVDGLDRASFRLPAHFFGVYDGHGGVQVANYCRKRIHAVLTEELLRAEEDASGSDLSGVESKKLWEKAFMDCFSRVDAEVGGNAASAAQPPIAPDTVGSTAVVAVVCSSHVIVANCGDSRAVLCRGKQPLPLSLDHKPNREDEYARIEALGGKVIQWNGYRVLGVLAMSRSIGDKYLKPYIIPVPEVTVVARAKDDDCLILASDGLWDVMSNEEVCEAARKRILLWHKKNAATASTSSAQISGESSDPAAQAAADYLSKLALQKGSKDNITVVVVDLKAHRKRGNDA